MVKIHLSKQDLLARKLSFFLISQRTHICCGYSLEAPYWGASNEYYPQHMFSSRNKKNIYLKIWILSLARSMNYLSQDKLIKISYLPSGKWDSWTSRAWYFNSSAFSIVPLSRSSRSMISMTTILSFPSYFLLHVVSSSSLLSITGAMLARWVSPCEL